MSAAVNEIHRFQAYCIDCGWWCDELESEEAAAVDANEHDVEHHGSES